MARFEIEIESLTLIGGERQVRNWNSRIVEPGPASPQAIAKGNLYVLMELGGEVAATARLYRLLLNAIQGVYYDSEGGISGGLTAGILAAHQALQEHNAVYPEEAQLGGVSCAVLRGDELYLGVGGPAMVVVGHPERVEQFPSEISAGTAPLGGGDAPTVEIFRTSVDDEANIIQFQSDWVARIPPRKLAGAALAADVEAAQEYLQALAPTDAALSALFLTLKPRKSKAVAASTAATDQQPTVDTVAEVPAAGESKDTEAEPAAATGHQVAPPLGKASEEVEEPEAAPAASMTVPGDEAVSEKRRSWLLPLALAIPILLVVVLAVAYWWQQRNLQLEFQSLLQGAEAALEAATEADTPPETARLQLQDAQQRILQAEELTGGSDESEALSLRIQQALDQVNQVIPLYKLITLQPLGGGGAEPARVVVQGSSVYILDQGTDQVLRYTLDPVSGLIPADSQGIVAQRGQSLADGQVVGELVDMTWAPAGGGRRSSNLLILDSNGNILEADDATGVQPLAIADREQWQAPRLISSYNGNLYVLDSGSGRILRYRPSDDGYATPPEDYFEGGASLDLSRAVDMAIDGNIWILYSDGTVQTFLGGRQEPFELETPPNGSLSQPPAIHVGPDAGAAQSLFIADSGGGRIVEYDKNGRYLRQYRPADSTDWEKLRGMRDLQVEEIDGVFYILTSDGLYTTDIPGELAGGAVGT